MSVVLRLFERCFEVVSSVALRVDLRAALRLLLSLFSDCLRIVFGKDFEDV